MDFIAETWNKAKKLNKTIVLPETEDARVFKSAELITQSKLAQVILIGDEAAMKNVAGAGDVNFSGIKSSTRSSTPIWINISSSSRNGAPPKG